MLELMSTLYDSWKIPDEWIWRRRTRGLTSDVFDDVDDKAESHKYPRMRLSTGRYIQGGR